MYTKRYARNDVDACNAMDVIKRGGGLIRTPNPDGRGLSSGVSR